MNTRSIGKKGEDIACEFLLEKGYNIISRNYMKRCGEIDIICTKDNIVCFIEVKSIIGDWGSLDRDEHRPEENVHALKLRRMKKTIEIYLWEKYKRQEVELMIHIITVSFVGSSYKVKIIENVVI